MTERLIWTLKREWLRRVLVIRGMDHFGPALGRVLPILQPLVGALDHRWRRAVSDPPRGSVAAA